MRMIFGLILKIWIKFKNHGVGLVPLVCVCQMHEKYHSLHPYISHYLLTAPAIHFVASYLG